MTDGVVNRGRPAKEKKVRHDIRGRSKTAGKSKSKARGSAVNASGSAKRAPVNSTRSKRGQRSRLQRKFVNSIRCVAERREAAAAHGKEVAQAYSQSRGSSRGRTAKKKKKKRKVSDSDRETEKEEEKAAAGGQLLSRTGFGLLSTLKFW